MPNPPTENGVQSEKVSLTTAEQLEKNERTTQLKLYIII
jgi:hypothetical protein